MIQRGKRSAAALSVVTPIPGQRPAAPKGLTPAEAAVWKATVATKPAQPLGLLVRRDTAFTTDVTGPVKSDTASRAVPKPGHRWEVARR